MKKKYLIKGYADHIKSESLKLIRNMVDTYVGNLIYPFIGEDTGEVGDTDLPQVKLPNDNVVNLFYFEYEELV